MARERREAEAAAQKALERQPAQATPEGFYAPYFKSEFQKACFVQSLLKYGNFGMHHGKVLLKINFKQCLCSMTTLLRTNLTKFSPPGVFNLRTHNTRKCNYNIWNK